jgi:hypothetical protein
MAIVPGRRGALNPDSEALWNPFGYGLNPQTESGRKPHYKFLKINSLYIFFSSLFSMGEKPERFRDVSAAPQGAIHH